MTTRTNADGAGQRALRLGPVHVPTAVDEVMDRLLTAIALGEFVPGERLPAERELARLLNVSRSTVHEGLRQLQAGGALEVRRGRLGGSFVRDSWNEFSAAAVARTLVPHREELEQLCDLRCRFEEVVARTAAERRTVRQARELRDLLAVFAAASTPEEDHAADLAVHEAVLRATRNPQMAQLSHDLLARVSFGLPIEPYDHRFSKRALAEHTALVEAIHDGRVDDAGTIARRHFSMSARTLRAVIARGDDELPVGTASEAGDLPVGQDSDKTGKVG